MTDKCPICGTMGKMWNKDPMVFACPCCDSLYSEFGLVMDPQKDLQENWS